MVRSPSAAVADPAPEPFVGAADPVVECAEDRDAQLSRQKLHHAVTGELWPDARKDKAGGSRPGGGVDGRTATEVGEMAAPSEIGDELSGATKPERRTFGELLGSRPPWNSVVAY